MGSQTCDPDHERVRLSGASAAGSRAAEPIQAAGPALSVVYARDIADAFEVIRVVRTNQTVLVNCSQLASGVGSRLIDICSGGVCAMDGQVHHISADLVLFAPALTRLECS